MKPNASTSLYPSSAEAITPGATKFSPSVVWADTGGTVTVIPAEGDGTFTVTFTIPDASTVPVMVIAVTAATASGLKRIF